MLFLVATNVVASRPPERQSLERRTLVPIKSEKKIHTIENYAKE